jgi:hypothetical protein
MSNPKSKNTKKLRKKNQKRQREEFCKSASTSAFIGKKASYNDQEDTGQKENKSHEDKEDKKVKIVMAEYKSKFDLIILGVRPIDEIGNEIENTYRMTLRFSEIKRAYNIKANVPIYLIQKFCKDLIGKIKTLKSLGAVLPDKKQAEDMSENELQDVSASFWHQYPCWETYLLENE